MMKIISAVFALILCGFRVQAQGTISFGNNSTTLVTTNNLIGGAGSAFRNSISGIKVQLYYQPNTGGAAPYPITDIYSGLQNWEPVGSPVNIGPIPGRFGSISCTTSSDIAPGGQVWLQAVAWDQNATSYSDAGNISTYFGASAIWSQGTGDPAIFTTVSTVGLFPGLVLTPVYTAIIITQQPMDQVCVAGSNATFSFSANVTNSYTTLGATWFFNGSSINSGLYPSYIYQVSNGVVQGSITITNAQLSNSGVYSVNLYVPYNPYAGAADSSYARLTVTESPIISSTVTNLTNNTGDNVTINLAVVGTSPLFYQWLKNGAFLLGATNSILVITNAQSADSGSYSVFVSNQYGSATGTIANLTILYAPVAIIEQPQSQVVSNDTPVTFGILATGIPQPSYQWTLNSTNIVGAVSNNLTISHVHLSDCGNYQVLVSNGYTSTNSAVATLNIYPFLASPFSGASTVWGTGASLSVGAVGSGGLTYQWFKDGVAVPGATNATLDFGSVQFANGGFYSVVATSPYGSVTNVAEQVVVNTALSSLGFSPALTITGSQGYSYIIQRSSDLSDTNNWMTVTNLTLTSPVQLWVDTNVDATSPFNSRFFYRILPGQ